MISDAFKSLVVEQGPDQEFVRNIREKTIDQLPAGKVLVRVVYSSLNYKDALSAIGNRGVTRQYPHTPGIDAAGVVEKSDSPEFAAGDEVIVTSHDLGMNTPGGFGQYIRVPDEWVVKLPRGLTLRESMIYGTAGLTAALSVLKLEENAVPPDKGDILVTGASGGVGSIAVSILAQCGYRVVAVSGKNEAGPFLMDIGAAEVISREQVMDTAEGPLAAGRYAGAVDTVGGPMLAAVLKSIRLHGIVTCCGNVSSPALTTTVFPFILRGIGLMGISSQNCPMPRRVHAWQRLSGDWKIAYLEKLADEVGLTGLEPKIQLILKGKLKGRTLVNLG